MENFDVAIIGGGAAGLACASTLLKNKAVIKVAVIEGGERLGKKLSVTGNGQGNISNVDMTVKHFRSGNLPLVEKIACSDAYEGSRLFNCLFTVDDRGRIYPAGKQASSLTDSFMHTINAGGAKIFLKTKATDISSGFKISLSDGSIIKTEFVVLCAGGKAQKQFGTDGSSYALAKKFGHKITSLSPSLVQLKTELTHIKTLRGIRADCLVTAIISGQAVRHERGDVIFTDYGVSGNAIFSVSPIFSDAIGEISIEFLPDIPAQNILADIKNKKALGYETSELLSGTIHNSIGRAIMKRSGGNIEDIVKVLKDFRVKVTGTLGFDYAQVTRGGVNMDGVDNDLQSKFAEKLYFAGEILDVDGDCGGYNLQWAFTSGKYAAEKILIRLKNH